MRPARRTIDVVEEDAFVGAIGRRGKPRLTSRLTGWAHHISKDESVTHAFEQRIRSGDLDPCENSDNNRQELGRDYSLAAG